MVLISNYVNSMELHRAIMCFFSGNESVVNKKGKRGKPKAPWLLRINIVSWGLNYLHIKARHVILNTKMVIQLLTHVN